MNADDALLSVYQDWVHKNPGINLDGGINEGRKWQARWDFVSVFPYNARTYHMDALVKCLS